MRTTGFHFCQNEPNFDAPSQAQGGFLGNAYFRTPIDTPPCSKHLKPPGVDEWQGDLPFDKVASGSYIESMRSVGLKTLKNKLSEYIRLAAGGETVLVTDRDRVVAEIGPPGPSRSPLLSDALLIDAFRQGWMTPPISVGRGPPQRKPVMTIDELLSNLQRDRADR